MRAAVAGDCLVENWGEKVRSRPRKLGSGIIGALTGPELVFVLEVISNLVFHTTNSFMSSLRGAAATQRRAEGSEQTLLTGEHPQGCMDMDVSLDSIVGLCSGLNKLFGGELRYSNTV
jgi:hypothetical protein